MIYGPRGASKIHESRHRKAFLLTPKKEEPHESPEFSEAKGYL